MPKWLREGDLFSRTADLALVVLDTQPPERVAQLRVNPVERAALFDRFWYDWVEPATSDAQTMALLGAMLDDLIALYVAGEPWVSRLRGLVSLVPANA